MKEQECKTETVVSVMELKKEVIDLLKKLIAIPSFSKQEDKTCDLIQSFLSKKGFATNRKLNNVWCYNKYFDDEKPTILLNSHHDTVKPNPGYTMDPFEAFESESKLFGLGSNDAGGALVSLLATFLYFYEQDNLKYNFIFAATAEEEISGKNGIECVLPELPKIDFAVVGEPTQMQMAVAEKGLMVLDCEVEGIAGHAAREEGDNALYKALGIVHWFAGYRFSKVSPTLGNVKMSVTVIKSGEQHNVVPALCQFTVDVRTTDMYTNEEVLEIIKKNVACKITPRSTRLQSSSIRISHPFVMAGSKAGRTMYGSPTTSDQALMNFPSLKMGPGDSARSHSADEYIFIHEIEEAIDIYINIFGKIN